MHSIEHASKRRTKKHGSYGAGIEFISALDENLMRSARNTQHKTHANIAHPVMMAQSLVWRHL